MFARLGGFAERRAPWVLGAWVGVAVLLMLTAPSLQDVGSADTTSFLPADSPSQQADRLLQELFPDDPARESALIVLARRDGLTGQDRAYASQLAAFLASPEMDRSVASVQTVATAPDLAPFLRSPDGQAELMVVSFQTAPFTHQTNEAVADLRGHLESTAPDGLVAHVTGIAGLATDQADASLASFDRTAIITVLLVLAILVLVYRSVVAPLVPMFTIGVAFVVAQGMIALMAKAGFEVASMAGTFMVVMVFGAGTDYCLFIVSRYREELTRGETVPRTVRRTMTVIGAVITASAATVIVAFLSQLTAEFGIFRTMGPAMGVAIAVTLLAALTLTPAVLRLAGGHVFWPRRVDAVRASTEHHSPRWERLGTVIRGRPRECLLTGLIALQLPAAGLGWYRQSFDLVNDLPASADAREGFEELARHYPGGTLSPVYVVVQSDGPILDDAKLAAIDRLTDALRAQPSVAEVRSVTQPAGAPLTAATLAAFSGGRTDLAALGLDPNEVDVTPLYSAMAAPGGLRLNATFLHAYPQLADRLSLLLGADGRSTRLIVAMDGNPYDQAALDAFRDIDNTTASTLAGTPLAGARLAVGGPSSFYADIRDIGNRDFRMMAVVLVGAIFMVLAALLRSLVAPFYLLATVVLSYAATLGLCVAVFQGVFGDPGMTFWLPPFLFIILVALGADYNIFIMSRIREEADAGHAPENAAIRGLVLTGRVITSAGLILAGTFAALVFAPLPNLRQIGFAVTAGVLIDTFLVRSVLVPAATVLLRRWAFWPAAPGSGRAWATIRPRQAGLAGAGVLALGALLVGIAAAGSTDAPIATVASASPTTPPTTATGGAAPAPPDADRSDPAPTAPTAPMDQMASREAPAPTSAPAPAASAGPPAPVVQALGRVAAPVAGRWRYRVEGTRKIGVAGSTQPFTEDVTTQVSRTGGSDDAPEMRLRTESGSGIEEYLRRYRPEVVELLSTSMSSGVTSFGGTFQPPQLLIRWPIRIGDAWSSDWTTGSTSGHSQHRVVGARDVALAGRQWRCYDIRTDSTFTGDAEGEQHQTACWVPELGMSVDDTQDYRGTYNGVSFDISTHTTLISPP